MKLLIVGGAGYIGSVLIPELIDRGYDIDVIDFYWFGNHLPEEVKGINKDIFDLNADDVKDYDQVIFLAGLSNDSMAKFSPSKNFIYNSAAPAFLAYLSKSAGVKRFIYAGSCSVYGYTVDKLCDEESPAISKYPYGISKLQGEQSVLGMVDDEFSVIAFRQGTVSGFSPRMRLDLVVNTMFKFVVSEKTITINNPAIWRPILSIRDAATAYIRAIEANKEISGVFNISSGNYTVGEIGDLVRTEIKKHLKINVKLNIKHIQDYRSYKVSCEKANNILSFHPKYGIEDIVEDLIKNKEKFSDFSNLNYYNIEVFKKLEKSN